ncbi:hypothetical protein AcW1_001053 [Taiwanofungus camphoratus]|nr:hypothetical protein AcW1_001053 [Antrodia cinnamomea]
MQPTKEHTGDIMHGTPLLIEVCVDSVESAIAAKQGGADRLELCANLGVGGGTTPSLGLLRAVQRAVPDTPIMVRPLYAVGSDHLLSPYPDELWLMQAMVRPRTGDFLYSEAERNVMLEDMYIFKQSGASGVVFGILRKDGTVDVERVTRAFDMTRDPIEALNDICGHGPAAPASLPVLRTLLLRTNSAEIEQPSLPTILPGSGISPSTVHLLLDALLPYGLRELHLSAGGWVASAMEHRPSGMGMGTGGDGEWGVWRASAERVREVRSIADCAWRQFSEGGRAAGSRS